MIQQTVLSLDQIDLADAPSTGAKAATLGHLRRAGLPVPDGFVVPTRAYQCFVRRNGIASDIIELERRSRESSETGQLALLRARIVAAFERGRLPEDLADVLRANFTWLIAETGSVVVRSSAIGEDGAAASFAGQHLSVLNVQCFEDFLQALRRCWASLFSQAALRYRARFLPPDHQPAIAAIAQAQIISEAAGTLFTVEPVSGAERLVVEAVWGMGEALALGEVSPDRYLVNRETLGEASRPRIGDKRCQRVPGGAAGTRLGTVPVWRRRRPVLGPSQLGGLALLGLQIERLLGAPQDVEWGLAGGHWYIFQARPITTAGPSQAHADADGFAWTSGFLDERLSEPVSPLGWSILRAGLEEIALRDPLRMLGVDVDDIGPVTRLWNGRPYINVAVFEALYKLFPDWLLPEDARRFFPDGDVARRHQAQQPRSVFEPRVWYGLLAAVARAPASVSPLHNTSAWEAFERDYVRAIAELGFTVGVLEREPAPGLGRILKLVDEVERHNRRLLEIHRWSLTYAEVCYSLLRRVARRCYGAERATAYCAGVAGNLGDYSVDVNRALRGLTLLAAGPDQARFQEAFQRFLRDYGHRSFSLDLIRPSFGADPAQVRALIQAGSPEPHVDDQIGKARFYRPTNWLLAPLERLTRRYLRLRENQRLTWQRGLAVLRKLYLLAGQALVRQGILEQPGDIFFLTAQEVRQAATDLASTALKSAVIERKRRYAEQCQSNEYPRFLQGNRPWESSATSLGEAGGSAGLLRGEPVSPGVGRGKARVILRPDDLEEIRPGEVLVTRGADPGWTPVFDRVAALVMETGGQLSHASVVAREYRLPAVVGIAHATNLIQSGDDLVVDGSTGVVRRLS